MNRIVNLFLFCLFSISCFAQKTDNYTPSSAKVFGMEFETRHIDLGSVKQGEKREFDFFFTNTGTEDIEIEIVSACECSTLDWPVKAVKPGDRKKINVIFDSTEKEESETVEIDINLKNRNPDNGYKRLEILSFSFELVK